MTSTQTTPSCEKCGGNLQCVACVSYNAAKPERERIAKLIQKNEDMLCIAIFMGIISYLIISVVLVIEFPDGIELSSEPNPPIGLLPGTILYTLLTVPGKVVIILWCLLGPCVDAYLEFTQFLVDKFT